MRLRLYDRRIVAGVVALYALVVGLLLPSHFLAERPAESAAVAAGPVVDAWCQDGDCHDPAHHHGSQHHDPATCGSCAQAKTLAAPMVAGHAVEAVDVPRSETRRAAPAPKSSVLRARPPARGPPLLS